MPCRHAENEPSTRWKTVIDFTNGGVTEGVAVKRVLKVLKNMNLKAIRRRDESTYSRF